MMISQTNQTITSGSFFDRLCAAARRDPKRAWLLAALVAVMITLWARMMLGGHGPLDVAVAATNPTVDGAGADGLPLHSGRRGQPAISLAQWARQPLQVEERNLFAVPYDQYPMDPAHPPAAQPQDEQPKSIATATDKDKEHQTLVETFRGQAASLAVEGTLMGANPRAWINGVLVSVGQQIGSTGFSVAKIEPRRIFIEKQGVQIELSMK
jgi:hypothetical protein